MGSVSGEMIQRSIDERPLEVKNRTIEKCFTSPDRGRITLNVE
jgi:hypothetical protein